MQKKILYLVTEDWYFWSHRLSLAEASRNLGFEIIIVTRAGNFSERIKAKGFNLVPLKIHRTVVSPVKEIATLIKLVRIYRKTKPDLVHHISLKPVLTGSVAAWIAGVPHIVNAYTGLGYIFISRSFTSRILSIFFSSMLSLLLQRERYYSIVQNQDDKKDLLQLGLVNEDRLKLIRGSGVDTDNFQYSPENLTDNPIVVFASRLLRDKGILEYISAVRLLKAKNLSARFVIVGDLDVGNPTSIKQEELEEWIEQDIIEWWGHSDKMSEIFRQVHVVCLPSYREGLPKVLLEAASCGRAIVTTDVPGCREVVIDGVNGLLVPVKEHVKLAESIENLLASSDIRKQMGVAGRKRVEDYFDVSKVNMDTTDLYNDLILK